jgi:hypothetical protein
MDPALGVLRVVLWFQEIAASGVWEGGHVVGELMCMAIKKSEIQCYMIIRESTRDAEKDKLKANLEVSHC